MTEDVPCLSISGSPLGWNVVCLLGAFGAGEGVVLADVADGLGALVAVVARAHAANGAHWVCRCDVVDGRDVADEVEVGREVEPVGVVGGARGRAL